MKIRTAHRVAMAFACVGMATPPSVWAASPTAQELSPAVGAKVAPQVNAGCIDIQLVEGGLLSGQVVNVQGAVQSETPLVVSYQGRAVAQTTTDGEGRFAVRGLRSGQYDLLVSNGVVPCRLWAERAAPPAAKPAALIVVGSQVVTGQGPMMLPGFNGGPGFAPHGNGGGIINWMQGHPMIVAGAVVTAVAVPVAISSSNDDPSS